MKSLKKSKHVKKVQNKFAFYKCFVHLDTNKTILSKIKL